MTMMLGVNLTGRDVLLVGGGEVAARRGRRLLNEGAQVRVVAPALCPALSDLVADGLITWIRRSFHRRDLRGAWLVHSATGRPRTDLEVAALCERHRVFCVNASNGDHGTARFTAQSIAGDVVVGVMSVAGVDPGRSVAVRDAISTLLAEGALPTRSRRRGGAGSVALVGGGPGPLDLMTVRARRLLTEADVVVTDRLGPGEDVIAELPRGVEVIRVGKWAGHHPVPQGDINRLIVDRARAGDRVVRLKGGDPFVLGRGGEEYTACLASGVSVDVVPGITSAVAVPEAAGIPVTHRGTATALHIVSGHNVAGPRGASASTLAALADPDVTTVVLMGVKALPQLVAAALDHGVPADRPVAIVENGHTPGQRTTRTSLAEVVRDARDAQVRSPAVIVIGEVARDGLLLPAQWKAPAAMGPVR